MKRISKLLTEVRTILSENIESRNCDTLLTELIMVKHYAHLVTFGSVTRIPFISLRNKEARSMCSKIERCRRKIQETEFLPTDWKVAKQRKIAEATWRAYITFNN